MPGGFHPTLKVIASWPKPNYVDPETQGRELFAISISLSFIATVVVILRLLVRIRIQRQVGPDDLLLTLGLIFSVGQTGVLAYSEFQPKWYSHAWDVPREDHVFRHLHGWILQFLFVFSTSCTKSSILLLYKRVIQGTVNAKFILIVKTAIGSIFVYFFVFFFLMIFQCKPTESFWKQFSLMDPYTEDFHCIPESHVPMANAAVSVLTDFVSACLPIFLFVQVHLPIRQKISLGILFAVGFVICVLGVIRTVVMHHLFFETYDLTWVIYYVWLFMLTENHLGVICATIPPLRALITRRRKKRERKAELEQARAQMNVVNGSNSGLPSGMTRPPVKVKDPNPLVSWDSAILKTDHSMVQSMKVEKPILRAKSNESDDTDGTVVDLESCLSHK